MTGHLLKARDVAEQWQCSIQTVWRRVDDGDLRHLNKPRRITYQ